MTRPSPELQTLKAEFFRALAHPLRIRIVEILAAGGERTVGQLQDALGVGQSLVSQQLARLRASGVVDVRKVGTTAVYALADPLVGELLAVSKQIMNRRLVGTASLLRELGEDRARPTQDTK